MKARKMLSAKELVDIYTRMEKGEKARPLAEEYHASVWTVANAHKTLIQMLAGEKKPFTKPYKKALAQLRGHEIAAELEEEEKVSPTPPVLPTDNLKKLEQAFMDFQKTLVEVIVDEAQKRSETLVQEKEQELQAIKGKYEKELLKMQEILVVAQNSNMVGMLQKAWGLNSK